MMIVSGPSAGLLFMVVVLGVLGPVIGEDLACDPAVNKLSLLCGTTCNGAFSTTAVLSSTKETTSCFCKEKVGGSGKNRKGVYYESSSCEEGSSSCEGATCPSGNTLYGCSVYNGTGADDKKLIQSICTCGTGLAPPPAAEQNPSGGRRGKFPSILAKLLVALRQVSRFYGRQ